MHSGIYVKNHLNAHIYAPRLRKSNLSTSDPASMTGEDTDIENQKTQNKLKKHKNLVIQTNFEIEPNNKYLTPKTASYNNKIIERRLFYPKSCKNGGFSPQAQRKNVFNETLAFPRTTKNSPLSEMEKQSRVVFSSKDIKSVKKGHFLIYHKKRGSERGINNSNKTTFNTKELYKKSTNRPNINLKSKVSQKENNMLRYNNPFSKTKSNLLALNKSKIKTQSFLNRQVNYFKIQKLSMKAICYSMDCTETLMNCSLTFQIGAIDNVYFENYIELINANNTGSAEEVFDTDKGQTIKTYMKYEYLFILLISRIEHELWKRTGDINEMLKLCVDNRFILLNLMKTEPDIKTPSKTLMEEFLNEMQSSVSISDREAALELFTNNTHQFTKSLRSMTLRMSRKTAEYFSLAIQVVEGVKMSEFISTCTELAQSISEDQKEENIYQNVKPKRPNFIIQPYRTNSFLPPKRSPLEYTLVLDLDETLIHCKRQEAKGRILLRPYVKEFLTEMAKYYEIVVFTAADKQYANWVLDRLDTDNVISHRLYRCSTSNQNGFIFKDLCKLGRDLSKLLLVDNKPENFAFQPENGIEILSWYDDPMDNALIELKSLLKKIGSKPGLDLRVALKKYIQ